MKKEFSIPGAPTCCEMLFDFENPFFLTTGTCYTTNKEIKETIPSSLSNVRIWLDLDEVNRPSKNQFTTVYEM